MGVFRDGMEQALALRGLAPKTRSAYLGWVRRLVRFCRVVPDQLTTEQVRAFLLHLTQERKLSFSTFNQALNAARFFFLEVLKAAVRHGGISLPEATQPPAGGDERRRGVATSGGGSVAA